MTRIALFVATLLALSACREDSPVASVETSPGGIRYTLIQIPDRKNVTVHVAWPTDWAYREGVSKAAPPVGTQLILAGGAKGHPAGEAGERFADLGSEGSIYASGNDHIIGELTFERNHTYQTVEIANAHLRAPELGQMWFDRIRYGIERNMAEAQSQPAHAGFDAVRWAVFGAQPLRNALSLDDPGTFAALTRDDIVAWHAETFTRNPEAVVVVGGIDAEAADPVLDALFRDLPEADHEISRKTEPDFTPRRILLHQPDAETTTLAFIAPLPASRLGGEFEDLILTHALGGDDQSVLFNAVRTELGASYGFDAGIANYTREHRILFMTGEIETGRLADAARAVHEAYASFRQTGPDGDLEDRQERLEPIFSDLPDSLTRQARSELQSALDGRGSGRSLELANELAAVTADSVAERLRDGFPSENAFIVIAVSPDTTALPDACVIAAPREAADCR